MLLTLICIVVDFMALVYSQKCKNIFTKMGYGVTHVMIVACYHSLPLSACMPNFDLVGTSIPTSFNILVKMFLHLFHWFLLCVYSNTYKPTDFRAEFYLPCIPISRIASNCQ